MARPVPCRKDADLVRADLVVAYNSDHGLRPAKAVHIGPYVNDVNGRAHSPTMKAARAPGEGGRRAAHLIRVRHKAHMHLNVSLPRNHQLTGGRSGHARPRHRNLGLRGYERHVLLLTDAERGRGHRGSVWARPPRRRPHAQTDHSYYRHYTYFLNDVQPPNGSRYLRFSQRDLVSSSEVTAVEVRDSGFDVGVC